MKFKQISQYIWELKKEDCMNVPGRIFASSSLFKRMEQDSTLKQLKNVACLPGIQKYSIVLPDGHQGYGFPIGGVAALDFNEGGISPGGIGFDINCGVRLIKTDLNKEDIKPKIKEIVDEIFKNVPSGLGSKGRIKLSKDQLRDVLAEGSKWAINNGYGEKNDLKHIEEGGTLKPNNPDYVSELAYKRGLPQVGSLGAGNHFIEIEYISDIANDDIANQFGFKKDQVAIMVHTGSRGLGHQVASDYLREMSKKFQNILRKLPDRQLIYAPANSEMSEKYFNAMACAANFAWANRQLITHWIRESFKKIFPDSRLDILYDVAHNIAKIEKYDDKKVYVHRKGATRAFPGQPVLIPGHMGTGSYVLVGTKKSLELTFGSSAHGAGRLLSRKEATRRYSFNQIKQDLAKQGIYLKAASFKGASEEAPGAYKNLEEVVSVSHGLGIATKVARLRPLGVIKG